MTDLTPLLAKIKKDKTFKFSQQPKKNYKSMYEQDASNCWLFSAMNELYVNTGLSSNIKEIKNTLIQYWNNPDEGSRLILWWVITATQYPYIYEYMITPLKNPKEFVNLAKLWFAMRMARKNNQSIKSDIKDNYIVENVLKNEWWRHAVTIYRDWKYRVELGSRGDDNKYNNFRYTQTALLNSLKVWTIKPDFYFQFYKNDK